MLGKIVYHGFYRPQAALRHCIASGGPLNLWRLQQGRKEMRARASHLPNPTPGGAYPLHVHMLTGSRFWDMTTFCLWSLSHVAERLVAPTLYDDGSLHPEQFHNIQRLFPDARWVKRSTTVALLEERLPREKFPSLREQWQSYPNIRKLIDVHLERPDWKLVLDSDLLFFRKPDYLLEWLANPERPLHAVDYEESYGFPRSTMESLCGATLPHRLNVGICGLHSDQLDWEQIEYWTSSLLQQYGSHYFLEQALVAMLCAGKSCAVAPAEDYITCPQEPERSECSAVMHHYVAHSKDQYFKRNWINVLEK